MEARGSLIKQIAGALWKSRWTSWAPDPNSPYVSVDVKQHSKKLRICLKIEVDVLGSQTLIVLNMVSVDVNQHFKKLRSCLKVEVDALGSPSLTVRIIMVSVDLNQHLKKFRSYVKVEMDVPNRPHADVKQHLKKISFQCCFTSRETIRLIRDGAEDGHLNFHTAPGL